LASSTLTSSQLAGFYDTGDVAAIFIINNTPEPLPTLGEVPVSVLYSSAQPPYQLSQLLLPAQQRLVRLQGCLQSQSHVLSPCRAALTAPFLTRLQIAGRLTLLHETLQLWWSFGPFPLVCSGLRMKTHTQQC
jgi:hypothetical protein